MSVFFLRILRIENAHVMKSVQPFTVRHSPREWGLTDFCIFCQSPTIAKELDTAHFCIKLLITMF